jgi:hypothetical protein
MPQYAVPQFSTPVRVWIASALMLLGGVWLLLLIREGWFSVHSPEATGATAEAFYRANNMIGGAIALAGVLVGGVLLIIGQVKWSRQKRSRRYRYPRGSARSTTPPTVSAPSPAEGVPIAAAGDQPTRKRVRVRVPRRH